MRISRSSIFCVLLLLTSSANAQQVVSLSPLVQKYARVSTPKVVLEHVRVIDGTGRPLVEDQNVVIERGKIIEVRVGSDTPPADGTTVFDLRGNPATRISDIENVEIVFKHGVGYDSQKLFDSVKRRYGQY
jgi:hypothetical protein